MHAGLGQAVGVGELAGDGVQRRAGEDPEPGQPGELTHQRGLRDATGDQRLPHLGLGQRGVGQHLPRQAGGLDEPEPVAQRRGGLRLGEGVHERREVVRGGADGTELAAGRPGGLDLAVDDPVEQRAACRVVGLGVGEAQQRGVGPALALAVLDRLVGEVIDVPVEVPLAHGALQASAPAAELLDVGREGEQVRAGAADQREIAQRGLAPGVVGQGRGGREGEDGRVLPRRAAGDGDRSRLLGEPLPAVAGGPEHDLGVVLGDLALGGVVRAARGADGEEPVDPRLVGELEGVAARGVGHLAGVGLLGLRSA